MPFHPLIKLPKDYDLLDFTRSATPTLLDPRTHRPRDEGATRLPYSIGRYDEHRPWLYPQPQFVDDARVVHMGIDIGCPLGTLLHAPADLIVIFSRDNARPGDYGPTLIVGFELEARERFMLLGHLSRQVLSDFLAGDKLARGQAIGTIGTTEENGGWPPHVHVQLCRVQPAVPDLPGVVTLDERDASRWIFPDPRQVLGSVY